MIRWNRRPVLLTAAALAACLVLGTWLSFTPAAAPGAETRMFAVAAGSGVSKVASTLKDQGFIRSALAFRVLAQLTGSESQIKAGLYALTPAMSPREILRWMVQGKSEQTRLTFPEGYSVRQMAEVLEHQGIGSADRFMALAADPARFVEVGS